MALLGLLLSQAAAAVTTWNGYVTLASDYVYRGVSLLDSGASFQGSLEGRYDDTFVAGAWAANVDHQWWLYESRVSGHAELNLYTGIDFGCGSRCRMRVIVTGYLFPGSSARDWQEATASIAYADRVGFSIAYSPRGLGSRDSTRTLEGWVVQPLARNTSLSFDVGKVWLDSSDYWHARAGISQRLDRWVVELSRYWSDPKYQRYGFDDRSRRVVLSVSTAF